MIEQLKVFIGVFRPMRWYRNAFMLLGSAMATMLTGEGIADTFFAISLSFIAICLVASGNYGINEVFDAETDKYHPEKKFRALPQGRVSAFSVIAVSLLLYILGLVIAWRLGNPLVLGSLCLFIFTTGVLYNIPPIRLKDVPYADMLLESFGNPVRLLVGWYAVTMEIVPVSFIFIFWGLGILLMAGKRYAELRHLAGKEDIALYRRSLIFYKEYGLLLVMVAASLVLFYMFGVISIKHEIDLVILLPFVLGFVIWYFYIAHEPNSIVADPERIFENWPFVIFSLALVGAFFLIFYFKLNYFSFFLNR